MVRKREHSDYQRSFQGENYSEERSNAGGKRVKKEKGEEQNLNPVKEEGVKQTRGELGRC